MNGKVAVVAGGTGGLGKAVTLAFLNARAKVAVTYVKEEELAALHSSAGDTAASLTAYKVDVTDDSSVREAVTNIATAHRTIDVLVNTVGGYAGGLKLWKPIRECSRRCST